MSVLEIAGTCLAVWTLLTVLEVISTSSRKQEQQPDSPTDQRNHG